MENLLVLLLLYLSVASLRFVCHIEMNGRLPVVLTVLALLEKFVANFHVRGRASKTARFGIHPVIFQARSSNPHVLEHCLEFSKPLSKWPIKET